MSLIALEPINIRCNVFWSLNNVFSDELENCLGMALSLASNNLHEFVTVEHLLLSIIDDEAVEKVLEACDADISKLRGDLENFVNLNVPTVPDSAKCEPRTTHGFRRVFQRAMLHVQSTGRKEVTCTNVLIAIYGENDSHAVYFLHSQNVHRLDVVRYVSHGIEKSHASEQDEKTDEQPFESDSQDNRSALSQFTDNLNQRALSGEIDPLIGRAPELERTVQILCRRRKNNPLFVGDAGVGKTAIAEGLAKRIVDSEIPEVLANSVIYALDMGSLLAGTKYRGDFEQRLKTVVKELKKQPDAILFIDEIHTVIGAGAASRGTLDASNILKPLLVSGELRCMGSTTYSEYRGVFEKDRALSRRFQKIDVAEPTVDETIKILHGLKSRFEDHHEVRYTTPSLRSAAELSNKYITDRKLPDKAIDVIDEAGAKARIQSAAKRKNTIGVKQIEAIVSSIARIPPRSVSTSDMRLLKNIERDLKLVVFGQDSAIEALASSIKLARSGLADSNRPISTFLFSGPTGVGKTEVTRQLAINMGIELIRFDMSEYMERHTVSRLIGAPPGYVGFDQGGLLTEAINKSPHSVLLLDEIEKAHPDVFNVLLQVMDYGTLTDNNGRKSDFRNVIIVMTTNAGAVEMNRGSIGFTEQDHSHDDTEAIKKLFSPEFRNRLDSVIRFNSLNEETIMLVVDKFLVELEEQLKSKNVDLTVTPAARKWLCKEGFDRAMGARPMAKTIQEHIKRPVADELLFGSLAGGGQLVVEVKRGKLTLKFPVSERTVTG